MLIKLFIKPQVMLTHLSSTSLSRSSCQPRGGDSSQAWKNRTMPTWSSLANALTSRMTFSLAPSLDKQKHGTITSLTYNQYRE